MISAHYSNIIKFKRDREQFGFWGKDLAKQQNLGKRLRISVNSTLGDFLTVSFNF